MEIQKGARPIIGIVISQSSGNEQKQMLKGIIRQAQDLNMDTVILSNVYNGSRFEPALVTENRIYDLIQNNRLDGIILTSFVFEPELRDYIYDKIGRIKGIPVVAAGIDVPDFPFVNVDVTADFESMTDHLIVKHGFTRINMLTGPQSVQTSHERLAGYKASLLKHGIPFEQERIFFGDFWTSSGSQYAVKLIRKEIEMPEAVICANEFMAFGLCDTLVENGVRIPDDISVIGYEHIGERVYHYPVLTTCLRSRYELGAAAVLMLSERITGISRKKRFNLSGRIVQGDSCPCGVRQEEYTRELAEIRSERHYSSLNLWGLFEEHLTACRSVNDYIGVLSQFSYILRNIDRMYLCLNDDWCSSESADTRKSPLMLCYPICGGGKAFDNPIFFSRTELMPGNIIEPEKPSAYYLCPVYFDKRSFGYFILCYERADGYDASFSSWLKSASQALEFLRMKNDVRLLMQHQDLSVIYDSATGLYSSVGFTNALDYAISAQSGKKVLLLLMKTEIFSPKIRLDPEDDRFMYPEMIADTLKQLIHNDNCFCGRPQPDLYAFAAVGDFDDDMICGLIADKLNTLLIRKEKYIRSHGLDSYAFSCELYETDKFSYEEAFASLIARIDSEIEKGAAKHTLQGYAEFQRLRDDIYLEPSREINIEEICARFNCSAGHFRRLYKERFDVSCHQDIITSKIYLAKYLLITTVLDIAGIAEKCGYDDYKYFLRQFQQCCGHTPSQYRSLFY